MKLNATFRLPICYHNTAVSIEMLKKGMPVKYPKGKRFRRKVLTLIQMG